MINILYSLIKKDTYPMYTGTVKISPKGQMVLPKKIRDILNSNIISLLVNDQNQVILSPSRELGGVFSSYSKGTSLSIDEIREQAWQKSASDRISATNDEEEKKE